MNNPKNEIKALVLDIETAPMSAWIWNLKDQYVSHSQIEKDWYIIAWGAKWYGSNKFIYRDQRNSKNLRNDKKILEPLRNLLDEADYIITQNGMAFDWPRIKARLMMNRISPPSSFSHIDLYRELRGVGFTSHSLAYLTKEFCKKYKKLSHPKFPGLSLWTECMNGNLTAYKEMEKYNRNDVLSTEELYMTTKEWLPKVQYKLSHPVNVCTKCGGKTFKSEGRRMQEGKLYARNYCKQCGQLQKGVAL